jgi:hypothetical protein
MWCLAIELGDRYTIYGPSIPVPPALRKLLVDMTSWRFSVRSSIYS